jgi:hypothetical protein
MRFFSTKREVAQVEESFRQKSTTDKSTKDDASSRRPDGATGTPSLRELAMKKRTVQSKKLKASKKIKHKTSPNSNQPRRGLSDIAADYKFAKISPQLELKPMIDDKPSSSETQNEPCGTSSSSTWVVVSRIFGGSGM